MGWVGGGGGVAAAELDKQLSLVIVICVQKSCTLT